jgi:hypothetical protein
MKGSFEDCQFCPDIPQNEVSARNQIKFKESLDGACLNVNATAIPKLTYWDANVTATEGKSNLLVIA